MIEIEKITIDGEEAELKEYAKKEDVSKLSGQIEDLTVPDYVVEEAEATIAKVFSHGILGRTLRFVVITDTHEDSEGGYNAQITVSNRHAGQAIKYIANRIGLDFVAHLGDASSAGSFLTTYLFKTLCKDVEQINKFVFSDIRGIKIVFIPGNHDQFYCTDNRRLYNSGAYTLFGSLCDGRKDRVGGYGYFDIDDAKVRVVYLNTSDVPSATTAGTLLAMSQEQKNWLCETLIDINGKDDAEEWKILLLSHAPLDFGSVNIASDILLVYVNGGTYGSYTFTNNTAKIIGNAHGHVHCYSYGYMSDKIRRFANPNACFIGNNHYAGREGYESWVDTETYAKTAGTGKDTSFSLVTVDLDSGTYYVDNYGAGIDRVFSADYKPETLVVPTGISNISYSGATTVGATIDVLGFSYTVTYSDGTTAVKTNAVTVSPTTISAVGDNSVTISYTEENTTVSATVTIVGTSAPAERLFNLNRTYVSGTVGESIKNYLDANKAYLNVLGPSGEAPFCEKSCVATDITENSVTITESGDGGVTVGYPIYLPDIGTNDHRITFDYSGAGKLRSYYRYAKDGSITGVKNLAINDTAGVSGSVDATIPMSTGFDWLIIFLTSNTGQTKSFTNVSLTKVE